MLRSLNRRLSRTDEWVALNVVELNSACASRRLTTNLGVGRSNRSGRASNLLISRSFFCAIFGHLTAAVRRQHEGNTKRDLPHKDSDADISAGRRTTAALLLERGFALGRLSASASDCQRSVWN